ncbi:MAG TPA: DsbA family protein [Rhodospirillales bacterium]|nr:DsbA family protein [Rhodospirillales bacterium]
MSFFKLRQAAFAALLLAAAPAWAANDALTVGQKQEVREVVRQYLRENPEVLVEAIQTLQTRQEAKERERAEDNLSSLRSELENDPSSPVGGNPNGDVTVVEFFDYRCGFCKSALPSIIELLESDDKIRYVFREYPALGVESVVAARAALAAWNIDREKYMSFHISLMESKGELSESKILGLAAKVGLNAKKLRAAMDAPGVEKAIKRNYELGNELGISGTPVFIIGDKLTRGLMSLEDMKKAVAKARKG